LHIWEKNSSANWSAFAPNFEELEENITISKEAQQEQGGRIDAEAKQWKEAAAAKEKAVEEEGEKAAGAGAGGAAAGAGAAGAGAGAVAAAAAAGGAAGGGAGAGGGRQQAEDGGGQGEQNQTEEVVDHAVAGAATDNADNAAPVEAFVDVLTVHGFGGPSDSEDEGCTGEALEVSDVMHAPSTHIQA
jgi:hypothetical protein